VVLAIICLLLTACSSNNSPTSGAAAEHDHKPKLDVQLTVSGNQITVKVITDIHISEEHMGKARKEGEGHAHMYLDNGEKVFLTQVDTVFKNLAPGKHHIKLSLHNNDHTPFDVTKEIDFEIK
jgi:hypothetical protein